MFAAVFSIISLLVAFGVYIVHTRNRADAVRPELFVDKCRVDRSATRITVHVESMSNRGKGFASHIHPEAKLLFDDDGRFATTCDGTWVHDLQPGSTTSLDWRIGFPTDAPSALGYSIKLFVQFKDSHGRRYATVIRLGIATDSYFPSECPAVGDGITLEDRDTIPLFDWLYPIEQGIRASRFWWKLWRGVRRIERENRIAETHKGKKSN